MQCLQITPLENNCSKDIPSKLNNGLDFSIVYTLNSQKCSEFRQKLTRFILRGFFAKGKIGGIYIYETRSEKLFTTLSIHWPSSQFHLAQVTYYPILLLQNRNKIANLSSDCVPRIFLDRRM